MPNSWDLVPASLWPLQRQTPQADPGQGAGFVLPRSGPAAWPNFALDFGSPEAGEVLRAWAEPHAVHALSRQRPVDQNMPPAAGDPFQQMLADAKASQDLMVALLRLAGAAEKTPATRSDEQSLPLPAAGQ
jgi:hypothetical protein